MYISFKGGIRLENKSELPVRKSIEQLPAAPLLYFPVTKGYKPVVTAEDNLLAGMQLLIPMIDGLCPVHSPVSGRVVEVSSNIVVENDGLYNLFDNNFSDDIPTACHEAGIVDSKGRATYLKLSRAKERLYDTLLLNCIESEPYLLSAQAIVLGDIDDLVAGIELIMHKFGIEKTTICIDSDSEDAIKALKLGIIGNQNVELLIVNATYPQNDEYNIKNAIIGKDGSKVFVLEPEELCNIYKAYSQNIPQTEKILTLSGDRLKFSKAISVPVGTTVAHVLSHWEGFKKRPQKVIKGGPMTGQALFSLDEPIEKTTNAIFTLSGHEHKYRSDPSCIQCGKCLDICPMGLAPMYISKAFRGGDYKEAEYYGVGKCTLCGACAYVCPARMNLMQEFYAAKSYLGEDLSGKR